MTTEELENQLQSVLDEWSDGNFDAESVALFNRSAVRVATTALTNRPLNKRRVPHPVEVRPCPKCGSEANYVYEPKTYTRTTPLGKRKVTMQRAHCGSCRRAYSVGVQPPSRRD